jgi:diamine N-acetyltransferase
MQLDIKKAARDNIIELEALAKRSFTDTFGHLYSKENLEYHLSTTCSIDYFSKQLAMGFNIDLAYIGNHIAGYSKYAAVQLPITHDYHDIEIQRLYVDSCYHNKGIGKSLLEKILNDVVLAQNVYLGVWEHNHKAQSFYAHYRFKVIGEYNYHVGSHIDRELIMKR